MNVHNVMEEIVYSEVNELFQTAKASNAPWLTCTCTQCVLDTICYVLNRVQPRYIKSGRGLAHSQLEEMLDKSQISADINRIALEGMKQVLSTQRPHADKNAHLPEIPVFNFPTFVGRILDGLTFEPAKDISVLLLLNGKPAESIDPTWENPYKISSHTPGTYTFWVKPIAADSENIKKVFPFEIRVEKMGSETLTYFFELGITSETFLRTAYNSENSFSLPDLHIFQADEELDRMQG